MQVTLSGFQSPQAGQAAIAPWARWLERAATLTLRLVAKHSEARRAKATLEALERLGPRELADIGLSRADVDLIAATAPRSVRLERDLGF